MWPWERFTKGTPIPHSMARRKTRYDKLILHENLWSCTNAKTKQAIVTKIDADSVPAAYCKGFKISVADNTSESGNLTYSFYACYDSDSVFSPDRIIDHCVISPGGGTAYLNVNRKIWKREANVDSVGSPITIWAECSDTIDSATWTITAYTTRAQFTGI